ncbi:DUF4251 domain-containing protein [Persicobacter psychrovividus]
MKKVILISGMLLFMIGNLMAQAPVSKKEKRKLEAQQQQMKVKELLEQKAFTFKVDQVNPQRGGRVLNVNTDGYTMEIDQQQVKAYLPYFGRAFSADYGSSEGGVKFDQPMTDEEISYDQKKNRTTYSFTIKDKNEKYDCKMTVFDNGNATLNISFLRKDPISYQGKIDNTTIDK